ncbi:TPA: hypothetical protein N0F65_005573 [Lagenidium giganteum]|uniref:Endothelin-converting enzyme 1 n=1 Tax=Lagenidium giganteum TaxID=4803 RepID=A0AAV2Z7S7_9STRA|nr:TPA: hypothetical protein N0F65_005573 [Lagenidium giganteum]
MRPIVLGSALTAIGVFCAPYLASAEFPAETQAMLDTSVDPCDDFYHYASGGWLKSLELPANKSTYSYAFTSIQDRNDRVILGLAKEDRPHLTPFFQSCVNIKNASATVLKKTLERIAATTSKEELMKLGGELSVLGVNYFTDVGVGANAKNATSYVPITGNPSLTLPDQAMYTGETFKNFEEGYTKYITAVMTAAGSTADDVKRAVSVTINLEKKLAASFMPKVDAVDPVKTYNPMKFGDACLKYPLTMGSIFKGNGLLARMSNGSDIIITSPDYFDKAEQLVASTDLKDLQAFLAFGYVHKQSQFLGEDFVTMRFEFFGKKINGMKALPSRESVCAGNALRSLPDIVGEYYFEKMFDTEREKMITTMVKLIEDAMGARIESTDFLDSQTKDKAKEKLAKVTNLIGKSMQKKQYSFSLTSDSYLDNANAIALDDWNRTLAKVGQLVDRTEWAVSGAVVNAYYAAWMNQMAFPAGILQNPFFDGKRHPALNFGAIGVVVGHELTHGFDSSGRLFDGDGNLNMWWSNYTNQKFEDRASCMREQYNTFVVNGEDGKPLGNVDGALTLGENIADNGGLKLSYEAYKAFMKTRDRRSRQVDDPTMEKHRGGKKISAGQHSFAFRHLRAMDGSNHSNSSDSDTGNLKSDEADKLFFISFANGFAAKSTDGAAKTNLGVDVHSPGQWRVNGAVMNNEVFAKVFQCPSGSKMNPEKKCTVW